MASSRSRQAAWASRIARGVAPKEVRTSQIYRGALPFNVIQLIGLALIVVFPELVTWALDCLLLLVLFLTAQQLAVATTTTTIHGVFHGGCLLSLFVFDGL